MELYHDPRSRSVRPLILLEEIGVPYEVRLVSLERGEQRSAEHRRLHPLGQLPVLVDSGVTIFESVAICLYLADTYAPGRWCPEVGSAERGLYYQWCVFVAGSLEPALLGAYLEQNGAPVPPGTPELTQVMATLERALAKELYLLGARPSAADVLVGVALAQLAGRGVELPAAVGAYVERLMERPAFERSMMSG